MVIVLMGLYIYSKKLMWICLYKYTFSHFLTIKSEHDVFIIPTYIQIHPNIHTYEAIKNDKLYKSIIGNDWDRRCHCWELPLHHEVLMIYLEISLSYGHVFLLLWLPHPCGHCHVPRPLKLLSSFPSCSQSCPMPTYFTQQLNDFSWGESGHCHA